MNYSQQEKDPATRLIGLAVVVLLHVGLVYALVMGLGKGVIEIIKGPLETKIIEDVKEAPPPPPPPPPPPKVALPPPAWIPPVDINVAVQPDRPSVIAAPTSGAAPRQMAVVADPNAKPAIVTTPSSPARVDKNACRLPQYPPAAKRAEESGTTVLSFLVGADGKVKESKIDTSSGSSRLDTAARDALALCKFIPATDNGKPVANDTWTTFKYVWRLED